MRRLIAVLTPCSLLLALACTPEAEEPNAFTSNTTIPTTTATATATATDTSDEETGDSSNDTEDPATTTQGVPPDMPSTTSGDGDGDPNPTTTGDGDGDPNPTTTGMDAECGNGIIDDGEQCDGGNLGGFTCVDLGYSGGTLACDPITCTYDASGCVTDMEGGGGTTG